AVGCGERTLGYNQHRQQTAKQLLWAAENGRSDTIPRPQAPTRLALTGKRALKKHELQGSVFHMAERFSVIDLHLPELHLGYRQQAHLALIREALAHLLPIASGDFLAAAIARVHGEL